MYVKVCGPVIKFKGENRMRLFISSLIILLLLLLSSCGTSKLQSLNEPAKTNASIINTYFIKSNTFSNTSNHNNIVFKYPTIKGEGFEKSNKLIENYIHTFLIEMYGPDYSDLELTMDFTISFQNDSFISILFKGWGNVKTAAHPNEWFLSLNINLKNGNRVKLSDLYSLNDDFMNIYFEAAKKQVPEQFSENKEDWIRIIDDIQKDYDLTNSKFKETDTNYGVQSYFTPNGLGFSTQIPFAIGDHFETVIPYSSIEKHLKSDNSFELPPVGR